MRPRKITAKKSRKRGADLSFEELQDLIPLWNRIGAVLGHARRTGEVPAFGGLTATALVGLVKLNSQGGLNEPETHDFFVIERFFEFVEAFTNVQKRLHGKRADPKGKADAQASFERGLALFKEFIRSVGGTWKVNYERDLRINLGNADGRKGTGRVVVRALEEFMPDRYRKFCNRAAYDSKTATSKDQSKVITPDFSWYDDVIAALEPQEYFERYFKSGRQQN